MTPDMESVILSKLTEVAQTQASAAQASAVAAERMTSIMERMEGHFESAKEERQRYNAEAQRRADAAVTAIGVNFSTKLADSETWWRRALWIAVGLIALSNMLGVGLLKILDILK